MPVRLSIGIPTYNRVNLLRDAIDSAVSQTLGEGVEIIVSDDGSRDGTAEMVAKFGSRVRYVRQQTNLGLAGNHRALPTYATGDYFAYLQDDDRLAPQFAERAVTALDAAPNAGGYMAYVIAGRSDTILNGLNIVGPPVPMDWLAGRVQAVAGRLFVALCMFDTPAILPACVGRTERVRTVVESWPKSITLHFDRALAASLAAGGDIVVDPHAVAFNRFHPLQVHRVNYALHTQRNTADLLALIGYLDELASAWPTDWAAPLAETLRKTQGSVVGWEHDYDLWPTTSRLARDLRTILSPPQKPGLVHRAKTVVRSVTPPVLWHGAARLARRR
jgi:glycosyltransferase involved in cell wall biosynthesis